MRQSSGRSESAAARAGISKSALPLLTGEPISGSCTKQRTALVHPLAHAAGLLSSSGDPSEYPTSPQRTIEAFQQNIDTLTLSDRPLLQEYNFAMSGSDFKLTESVHTVFACERGTVEFYFLVANKQVGKSFLYTLEEAAQLGEQIFTTGAWGEFPVSGISAEELSSFGQRLRDYGVNGC
jgi:hypothetical protein